MTDIDKFLATAIHHSEDSLELLGSESVTWDYHRNEADELVVPAQPQVARADPPGPGQPTAPFSPRSSGALLARKSLEAIDLQGHGPALQRVAAQGHGPHPGGEQGQ